MNFSLPIISTTLLLCTLQIKRFALTWSAGKFSMSFYFISLRVTNSPTFRENSLGLSESDRGKYLIVSLMSLFIGIGTLSILKGSNDIDILLQ